MAGTTTKGFHYPSNADAPNVAVDIQTLASDVDTYLTPMVTLTGGQTLTNKTLTSPQINAPTISNPTFSGQATGLEIAFNQSIIFEGTTADAYELTLSAGEPTSDVTVTLPDETGTLTTQTRLNNVIDEMRMNSLMLGGM